MLLLNKFKFILNTCEVTENVSDGLCIVLTSFHFQSQAKFSPERAKQCVTWIEEVTGSKLGEMKDQIDFGELLKDGSVLCNLINSLQPGSVKKINTLKAPFKQVINCPVTLNLTILLNCV